MNMPRRRDIELLRMLAAFGIVWFHSQNSGHEISYGGLIFFLLLSTYLAGLSRQPPDDFILQRAKRLLLPWWCWFLIYGLINILDGRPVLPLSNEFILGILASPSIHLWFLPFMFVSLVVLDVFRMKIPLFWLAYGSAFVAIVLLLMTSSWRECSMDFGAPIAQYVHALPAIFIGVFFSGFDKLHRKIRWMLLLLILFATLYAIPSEGVGTPYLLGIFLGLFLLFPNNVLQSTKIPVAVSQCMLGVYLVHPLFLKLATKLSFAGGVTAPIFAFSLSTVSVYLARRFFPRVSSYCT
jgi:surface polysaccharide O-acyltransferase-like enzyme